jgi:hypothetical protein
MNDALIRAAQRRRFAIANRLTQLESAIFQRWAQWVSFGREIHENLIFGLAAAGRSAPPARSRSAQARGV